MDKAKKKYYIELTTDKIVIGFVLDDDTKLELYNLINLLRDKLHGKITEYPDLIPCIVKGIIKEVTGTEGGTFTVKSGTQFRDPVLQYSEVMNNERYTYELGKLVIHEITGEITPADTLPYFQNQH